jgi:Co/Zn/Cd efflux system component
MSPSLTIQRSDRIAVSASDNGVVTAAYRESPTNGSLPHDRACCVSGPNGLSHPDCDNHHCTPQPFTCRTTQDESPAILCSDSRSSSAIRNGGGCAHNDNGQDVEEGYGGGREDSDEDVPSNEFLLLTAFFSFMSFALMQLVFAFVAGSQAMMGDSAAMIVDAVTYLFNWIAERRKRRFDDENEEVLCPTTTLTDDETALESTASDLAGELGTASDAIVDRQRAQRYILDRTKRKMVLHLEVIPPIISVTTLAAVTVVVTNKAVRVLILDLHRNTDQQRRPNVALMLAFSIVNLFLDGMNVFCFARAKHLMGYSVIEEADSDERLHAEGDDEARGTSQSASPKSLRSSNGHRALGKNAKPHSAKHFPLGSNSCEKGGLCDDVMSKAATVRPLQSIDGECLGDESDYHEVDDAIRKMPTRCDLGDSDDDRELYDRNGNARSSSGHGHEHANLNMCSAYTHVFADTLRSIAVIIAAITAELVPEVTPEEADATAAVIVSFLIVMSLIPLVQGLVRSTIELRAIYAEERSDLLLRRTETVSFELT